MQTVAVLHTPPATFDHSIELVDSGAPVSQADETRPSFVNAQTQFLRDGSARRLAATQPHESAAGVSHGQTQAAGVHGGLQVSPVGLE